MEKFNLGLAVSGARKVVTRSGVVVTDLKVVEKNGQYPIAATVNSTAVRFTIEGKFDHGEEDDEYDLFLMPEEVKLKTKDFELVHLTSGLHNKFVTRAGYGVSNLQYNPKFDNNFPVIGGVVGLETTWTEDGKYALGGGPDEWDLMTVIEEDQPQGIKAYIETGRIKSSDGPNKSMPSQSVIDSIKYVAQSINNDPVNKPAHYTDGKIEVIDFIDDKKFDFCIGNAIKYLSRAGKKQNEIEDLEKAVWYINHKIKLLRDENS